MPLCHSWGEPQWEVRSTVPSKRIARVIFCFVAEVLVAIHAFIKKAEKLRKLLLTMETADSLDQLGYFPGWRLHPLKGDLKGFWGLTVTDNWRQIFAYNAATNTATLLDLLDYHGK